MIRKFDSELRVRSEYTSKTSFLCNVQSLSNEIYTCNARLVNMWQRNTNDGCLPVFIWFVDDLFTIKLMHDISLFLNWIFFYTMPLKQCSTPLSINMYLISRYDAVLNKNIDAKKRTMQANTHKMKLESGLKFSLTSTKVSKWNPVLHKFLPSLLWILIAFNTECSIFIP